MEEIQILSVDTQGITEPSNDGTPGSALYAVPFKLNKTPSALWREVFIKTWNSPPSWTSEHRPNIARVEGARIILDGTTIEEVKRTHKATLELCVAEANRETAARIQDIGRREQREKDQAERRAAARRNAQEQAKDIKFK